MNEITTVETEIPAKPQRHARANKRRPRAAKPSTTNKPNAAVEFAGVSATACCSECTSELCVISTVNVCKHPYKTGDGGCGPITMANRRKVLKLIKHQIIEARE